MDVTDEFRAEIGSAASSWRLFFQKHVQWSQSSHQQYRSFGTMTIGCHQKHAKCLPSKRNVRVYPNTRSKQHVRISLPTHSVITLQMEQENLIFVTPKMPTRRRMKCSAVRENQDIKRNEPFRIIVASFALKKKIVTRNQVVPMSETRPKLMLATKRTTGEMLGVVETRKSQTEARSAISSKMQDLTFPDVDANITTVSGRCLVFLWIYAVKHLDASTTSNIVLI